MASHHDTFFKLLFSEKEHVADFSSQVLPTEISRQIDFSTLNRENTSYVDKALSEHFSDMVYSCSMGKTRLKITLLFEHKSSPDKELPYQLNKYMVRIWGADIKQKQAFTPIIPIVFYHGNKSWRPGKLNSCFKNLPEVLISYIPDFDYRFVNLSDYSDEDIKKRLFQLASLKMGMLIFKHIYDPDTLEIQLGNFFEIGRLYFQKQTGLNFLESIVTYIIQATEIEPTKIISAIKPVTEKGEVIVMTTAEKLRKEGRKEGLKEGRKEGHKKGYREGNYNTLYATLQVMKKNGMTEEAIARVMDLELNLIKKIINKEEIEIPLHLLSQPNQ